jgi:hypothetical protein
MKGVRYKIKEGAPMALSPEDIAGWFLALHDDFDIRGEWLISKIISTLINYLERGEEPCHEGPCKMVVDKFKEEAEKWFEKVET